MRNNSPAKIILTDCDGVLVNWSQTFAMFMASKGYIEKPNVDHIYKMSDRYDGISDERMMEYVLEMNNSEWLTRCVPLPGAVENVQKLASEGYNFIVITAMSDNPEAAKWRAENLDNTFGKGVFLHDQMICLPPRACKRDVLRKWEGSGLFWLEDHTGHATSGYDLGLRTILMDDPHNRDFEHESIPRVSHWDEIYERITGSN